VKFNVADSCLAGPSFALRYVAIVGVFPGTVFSPYNGLFTAASSSELPNNAGGAFIGTQASADWYVGNDVGGNKFRDGQDTNTALTTANAPHVWENQFSSDRTYLWQVGRDRDISGRQWTDSVAEVIGLDYTPTPMQVEALREYLNERYGFTVPILPKAGLRLWLDSAAPQVTLNGGNVSGWADASGHGNNATQSTSVAQPLYEAAGWNSAYPSIRIDGETSNEFMTADSAADMFSGDDTPYTISWVGQLVNDPTNLRIALCVGATTNDFAVIRDSVNATDNFEVFTRDAGNTGSRTITC
jgi:hypothetical protein